MKLRECWMVISLAALLALGISAQTASTNDGSGNSGSQSGLDLRAIDGSANPCQDFYQYACGNWMKGNPIPGDESEWGRFNELHDRIQTSLRTILEQSEKHQDASQIDGKIGGFYQSCMNEDVIEKRGADPLRPELDRIAQVANITDLVHEVARLQERQITPFFNFGSEPDPKDAHMTIAEVAQGGLGLPERDYYFRTDAQSQEIRKKYVKHIANMFHLAGVSAADAAKDASTVMSIETALAKNSLDVTTMRNPDLLVHVMPVSGLVQLSPRFNFETFFSDTKTPAISHLNVDEPDFIKALNALLSSQSVENLKLYLKWEYLDASANLLSKAFVQEHFDFYGRTLFGQSEMKPRWKRCVSATDDELGEALGRKFVEETFGQEGKTRTLKLVHEIEQQMGQEVDALTWMTPETKKQALVKLHAVADKIGYPEKWRDYSSVQIVPDDYFGNWYRANEFESRRERDKIGKPVDRTEWAMTPPTINAYYDPTQNNINFPAGILQPPFYSNHADDAVNYGAIGVVIGHELTHAFDDQGRKYDAEGNLKDWWQKSDADQFTQLASCYVTEYNAFTVVPGVHVNGQLTLGENTADNGGLRLAYQALMSDLATKTVSPDAKIDGFTAPQQFFLGFAQVWCANVRPETARERAQTDPHSPDRFRVNGVVANSPQFSQAFSCKAGDALYTEKACRVW